MSPLTAEQRRQIIDDLVFRGIDIPNKDEMSYEDLTALADQMVMEGEIQQLAADDVRQNDPDRLRTLPIEIARDLVVRFLQQRKPGAYVLTDAEVRKWMGRMFGYEAA